MTYTPPVAAPPWLAIAAKEYGQKERRGGENPRIIQYHATTSLRAREDEVPWCASFVNWALAQAKIRGTNDARAVSWLNWGRTLKWPRLGCVTVIRHKRAGGRHDAATGSWSGNHVGFWIDEDDRDVALLGGNQGDAVTLGAFALDDYDILGYRWPHGVPLPPPSYVPTDGPAYRPAA